MATVKVHATMAPFPALIPWAVAKVKMIRLMQAYGRQNTKSESRTRLSCMITLLCHYLQFILIFFHRIYLSDCMHMLVSWASSVTNKWMHMKAVHPPVGSSGTSRLSKHLNGIFSWVFRVDGFVPIRKIESSNAN